MKGDLGAVLVLAVVVAGFWVLRRYLPPVACPQCGSGSWIILGDEKACRDCGHLFY